MSLNELDVYGVAVVLEQLPNWRRGRDCYAWHSGAETRRSFLWNYRTGNRCRRTAGLALLPPRWVSLRCRRQVARGDEDDEERREKWVR